MSVLFIAGDWGTSSLRLYLCEYRAPSTAKILHTIEGPGVSKIAGGFEEILFDLIDDWLKQQGNMPVILSGMVGANIGWQQAPYISCPMSVQKLAENHISFTAHDLPVHILPGLSTINYLGNPDVMRGEECQVYGWQHISKQHNATQLIALPGTHNKWVLVRGGHVMSFITALIGELFALLKEHSILISTPTDDVFNEDIFLQAVNAINKTDGVHLIQLLFTTRSRQIMGDLAPEYSLSYLAGLLIGADIIGALALFRKKMEIDNIILIGAPMLTQYYALALNYLDVNIRVEVPDIAQITLAGYQAIYQQLYE